MISLRSKKSSAAQDEVSYFGMQLRGERIMMRAPMLGDYAQWAKVRGENREFLTPYEPAWPENCLDKVFFQKRLARQAKDWEYDRCYCFLILDKLTGALYGGLNVNNVVRGAAHFASLGYWLSEDAQGKGYMSEALGLIIDFARDELLLHRLNAACIPENERSAKLLLGTGFTEEGLARNYLKINGRWTDHRLFGLVLGEAE